MATNSIPSVVSVQRPLSYYQWGKNCEAWNLADTDQLSVKVERMPPGSEEVLHYHDRSQQFFYILNGIAVFEINETILILHPGDGLQVEPGTTHRVMNKEADQNLEFLVCSQPVIRDDRHNLV